MFKHIDYAKINKAWNVHYVVSYCAEPITNTQCLGAIQVWHKYYTFFLEIWRILTHPIYVT